MMRILVAALAILSFSTMAGASTVMCPAPPNGGVPANVLGLTVSCGGLTFSNFKVIPATGFSDSLTPAVGLVSVDFSSGSVNLTFNPNLSAPTGAQDLHLYYRVTGPVSGAGLAVSGVNATIDEQVCSSEFWLYGPMANTCSGGGANLTAYSYPPGPNYVSQNLSQTASRFWVYSDIGATANNHTSGGAALTSFTQSWQTSSQAPEPASMLFIGTGFIALGLLRRRVRK
jgi:PEP-CTERM motif